MANRRQIPGPAPLTVGVLPSTGEEVEFITPTERPSAGLSRATVKAMIQKLAPTPPPVVPPPARAILPNYDVVTDASVPTLVYKITETNLTSIFILGENLTGITTVEVDVDVTEGSTNAGTAPVVGTLVVTDTSIEVPLNAATSLDGDFWGVILRDADGNVYAAPSSVAIVASP